MDWLGLLSLGLLVFAGAGVVQRRLLRRGASSGKTQPQRPGQVYGYGEDDLLPLSEGGRPKTLAPLPPRQPPAIELRGAGGSRPLSAGAQRQRPPVASPHGVKAEANGAGRGPAAAWERLPLGPPRERASVACGTAALATLEPSASAPSELPLALSPAAPRGAEAEANGSAQLPVRITDYDPTELLIIQYTPGHSAARPPLMTVHQVAAHAEIRLDGKTVVILENQRAAALLARDVLRLQRDGLALAVAS